MKKQIAILIVALIAINFSTVFGQVIPPAPRAVPVSCLGADALHPVAGTPYNYEVTVPSPSGSFEYKWFVTQDPNFITAGVLTSNIETTAGSYLASTGTGYNNTTTGGATLSLTWKAFTYNPLVPVFVVIQVKSTSGVCNPNNLKVYKILPVNSFTLDIANVAADMSVSPYSVNIDRCLSNMVSSVYDVADDKVKTDYGVDYLYFVVTAANFSTSWKPSVELSGIAAGETVTAVEWFRPTDAAFANAEAMPLSGSEYIATNPVTVLDPSGTVGAGGEAIVIRVTVDHTNGANIYEGLTDETITLAVDGKTQLSSPTPVGDVHFSSTLPVANALCGKEDGYQFDMATQVLKARPTINAVDPTPFAPIKP